MWQPHMQKQTSSTSGRPASTQLSATTNPHTWTAQCPTGRRLRPLRPESGCLFCMFKEVLSSSPRIWFLLQPRHFVCRKLPRLLLVVDFSSISSEASFIITHRKYSLFAARESREAKWGQRDSCVLKRLVRRSSDADVAPAATQLTEAIKVS